MKISTKGRYALRMLLDLAEHENNGFISLKEIHQYELAFGVKKEIKRFLKK